MLDKTKEDNCDSLLAGKIEQYALGYGPVSFLCIVILCKRLYFQETPDPVYRTMLRENAPLMIYPVLFHIVKLLGLAHRLYQITTTIHSNTILWIIHAAIGPLNSLSFAIVHTLYLLSMNISIKNLNLMKLDIMKEIHFYVVN